MINLATLLRLLNQVAPLRHLLDALADGESPSEPLGVPTFARPALLAALQHFLQRPILYISARADRARVLSGQLRLWSPAPERVLRLPGPGVLPYEHVPWNPDYSVERLAALTALSTWRPDAADEPPPLVIASSRALMQKTLPADWFRASLLHYRRDQRVDMGETLYQWVDLGYQSRDIVENPGEFSHRGGIMDVFPPGEAAPIRFDLFGDEIESIRHFDPLTQRSEDHLEAVVVGPATEAPPRHTDVVADALSRLDIHNLQPMAELNLREEVARLEAQTYFSGIEFYLPFVAADLANPLHYLPPDSLVIIENPAELQGVMTELEEQAATLKHDLVARHELSPDWPRPFFTWEDSSAQLRARDPLIFGFDPWLGAPPNPDPAFPFQRVFSAAPVFGGQIRPALKEIVARRNAGERIVLTSRQSPRLSDLLRDEDVIAAPQTSLDYPPPSGSITLFNGPLMEGWLLRPQDGAAPLLSVFSDAELFGVRKPQPRRRPQRRRLARKDAFFDEVHPGDYVVHIEHGIGSFKGLVKLDFDGLEREYLEVTYSQNDKLYVPIHQADRLSRYIGPDEKSPPINRLGTAEWGKTKKKARAAVADIAADLIQLYATREIVEGRRFSEDTPWQREMEAAFPFVETEDQLLAIADVKRDMENTRPMDRLVCGDVGYGKTEVALRAAFKAVMDGSQAAILVPTTVLAQQHLTTFQKRLKNFPLKVEMLSRFRTRKEVDQILKDLAAGSIDVIIGTHRLLQKDVQFKDLGLLVVDEEQRFGVSHKERLREMRANVDTLTLSATPIPRTLHMALTNVRDMSLIDTPPEERLPVKTTIARLDETLIRTAIRRELDRGGQVYFVHNRVQGIENIADFVGRLVPEARVTVGHGQMSERRLEKVMWDFAKGEYDVLVSTTIIESGLDIPNVNTIIINRADAFGLAQLYQLRGRVGRAAVQAYAYLLTPTSRGLTDIAQKRLEAIQEADELGAGFRIAMRDLEIRGAGDLLGARQHGHIAAVGFDLYVRLLTQAVQELKAGQNLNGSDSLTEQLPINYLNPLEEDIQINLPMAVFIPEDYLAEENLRLELYRRMANLVTLDDVTAMGQELQDRFGELPEPVLNLLYQLRLKVLCRAAGVQSISATDTAILVRAETLEEIDRQGLGQRLGVGHTVGRRQVSLHRTEDESIWQGDLEKTLVLLGRMVNDPAK